MNSTFYRYLLESLSVCCLDERFQEAHADSRFSVQELACDVDEDAGRLSTVFRAMRQTERIQTTTCTRRFVTLYAVAWPGIVSEMGGLKSPSPPELNLTRLPKRALARLAVGAFVKENQYSV